MKTLLAMVAFTCLTLSSPALGSPGSAGSPVTRHEASERFDRGSAESAQTETAQTQLAKSAAKPPAAAPAGGDLVSQR